MLQNRHMINKGFVDYQQKIAFQFNERTYYGYKGDTLASALLANGIKLIARSFKYHRPRGIFTASSSEPNALLTLHQGTSYQEPNVRATTTEIYSGLRSHSQNHVGALERDMMAVNDLLSPFLTAGFYYKTFMWPKSFWEKIYEPTIRNAAGLGKLSMQPDPARYEKGYLHTDVLVIGSGIAGITAALNAATAGLRVVLAEEDFEFGGQLINKGEVIDNLESQHWVRQKIKTLQQMPTVRLMKRCSVFGCFDHGVYAALERVRDHIPCQSQKARQHMWQIYASHTIIATGAMERSIGFANNDRPGIMLAGCVATYAHRFGVATGQAISIFTNNDNGWHVAQMLEAKGFKLAALIDTRKEVPAIDIQAPVYPGTHIINTKGRHALSRVQLNNHRWIDSDCLGIAGGWSPNIHLTCHMRGRPSWDHKILAFVPDKTNMPNNMTVVGAANGNFSNQSIIDETIKAVSSIISQFKPKHNTLIIPKASNRSYNIAPHWYDKTSTAKAFIDQQNDVTVKDIHLSIQEGFHQPEHVKRYTTLGMATDQGKNSNVMALAVIADATNTTFDNVGTTIYRAPYTPVSIAALAGTVRGKHYRPYRLPPSHHWATEHHAHFVEVGQWLRAQWFWKDGETNWRQAVDREVLATRNGVGVCDVSTLGKIDIKGKDCSTLLNFVYSNGFAKLAIGKTRYGLMLREDGIVMDDGTTARLGEHHYMMTTTTANAGPVFSHLEYIRQCLFPYIDVHLQSVTDQFAQYSLAGPNARKLLQKIITQDISNEAFPFMACGDITLKNGISGRLFRISFSGELAYEIAVSAEYGDSLIRCLMEEGKEFNITPYGTEALGVMRIEKGHVAGNELNGRTSAHHLGMANFLSNKKDFIGNIAARRDGLVKDDGYRLVGLMPIDTNRRLYAGAHLFNTHHSRTFENDLGWVSSIAYSPTLKHYIGLAFIKDGIERIGDEIWAISSVHQYYVKVKIASPHFFDPKGERQYA